MKYYDFRASSNKAADTKCGLLANRKVAARMLNRSRTVLNKMGRGGQQKRANTIVKIQYAQKGLFV